jgi:hypothetical protein
MERRRSGRAFSVVSADAISYCLVFSELLFRFSGVPVRPGSYRPVANSSLANRLQVAGKTIDWHPDRPGHESDIPASDCGRVADRLWAGRRDIMRSAAALRA